MRKVWKLVINYNFAIGGVLLSLLFTIIALTLKNPMLKRRFLVLATVSWGLMCRYFGSSEWITKIFHKNLKLHTPPNTMREIKLFSTGFFCLLFFLLGNIGLIFALFSSHPWLGFLICVYFAFFEIFKLLYSLYSADNSQRNFHFSEVLKISLLAELPFVAMLLSLKFAIIFGSTFK